MSLIIHAVQYFDFRSLKRWGGRTALGVFATCLSLGLCPSMGLAQSTEALGTLLYTPAQRLAISQTRQAPADGAATHARSNRTRLDGVVSRVRERGTAWINGEPVAQGSNPSTVIQGTQAIVDGHRLRVGQSIDKSTGEKSDVVAPGAVRKGNQP